MFVTHVVVNTSSICGSGVLVRRSYALMVSAPRRDVARAVASALALASHSGVWAPGSK
jgi:hypothetical protein